MTIGSCTSVDRTILSSDDEKEPPSPKRTETLIIYSGDSEYTVIDPFGNRAHKRGDGSLIWSSPCLRVSKIFSRCIVHAGAIDVGFVYLADGWLQIEPKPNREISVRSDRGTITVKGKSRRDPPLVSHIDPGIDLLEEGPGFIRVCMQHIFTSNSMG